MCVMKLMLHKKTACHYAAWRLSKQNGCRCFWAWDRNLWACILNEVPGSFNYARSYVSTCVVRLHSESCCHLLNRNLYSTSISPASSLQVSWPGSMLPWQLTFLLLWRRCYMPRGREGQVWGEAYGYSNPQIMWDYKLLTMLHIAAFVYFSFLLRYSSMLPLCRVLDNVTITKYRNLYRLWYWNSLTILLQQANVVH